MSDTPQIKAENASDKKEVQIPRTTGAFLKWILRQIATTKKWWLIPIWVMLAVLALVLFLSGNGALLPAIYMVM